MKKILRFIRQPQFHSIFIICLVAIAYGNSLGNQFVSDDRWIRESLPNDIGTILMLNPVIHLTNVFWWMIYQVFQYIPWPYRLLNIFAHLTSSILLYAIVSRLVRRRVGLIAASLFAVHPILIESVAWIAGGIYAQYGCIFLLSFYLYILGDRMMEKSQSRKSNMVFSASYFVYGLSILFSEKAVPLLLLFVVYEMAKGTFRLHWKRLIPFFFIGAAFMAYYLSLLGGRLEGVAQTVGQKSVDLHNPLVQIPTACSMYFQLLFWPDRLSFYQSELSFGIISFSIRAVITAGFFLGWIMSFFFFRRRFFLWFSWFFIPLLPTLTPLQIAWVVAERYVYLSSIGVFVLFAIAYDAFLSKSILKKPLIIIFILILFGLVLRTAYRNLDWQSEDTLWLATAQTAPSNQFTWNNMGDYYSRRGDLVHAAESFRKSIAIAKGYAPAYYNLAGTLQQMGETGDAILLYEKALAINPDFWEVHRELASIYLGKGSYDAALGELTKGRAMYLKDPVMNTNHEVLLRLLSEEKVTTKSAEKNSL